MIIDIEDELFNKLLEITKARSKAVHEQLLKIKTIEIIQTDTLQQARDIKTNKVKQSIAKTIKELLQANITPTKYQIHKRTNIAYVTLTKYYDDILDEVQNDKKI